MYNINLNLLISGSNLQASDTECRCKSILVIHYSTIGNKK